MRFLLVLLISVPLLAQDTDAVAQSRRAKALLTSGHAREAIPIYEELVRRVPGDAGLLFDLGLAQHAVGQDAKALPNIEKALALQPKLPGGQQMLAETFLMLERWTDAAFQYRSLAQLDPKNARVWYGLGRCYEALSGQTFDELLKQDPESPYVVALLGAVKTKQHQYSAAGELLSRAIAAEPDLVRAHADLAEVYRNTNRETQAQAEQQRAHVQCPVEPSLIETPECRFATGRFLELAQHDPRDRSAVALYWRIQAYDALATKAFAELGRLPDSPELHEIKAQILRNRKQYVQAAEEWREVLRLSPENLQAQHELALSYFLAGDFKTAMPLFEKEIAREPQAPDLNYLMGDCLLHEESPEKAVPYLEKAVRLDPELLPAHASLGLSYARLGDSSKAIPHLKNALEVDEDGSLHYQLSRAYQATGQSDLAKQTMREYQEIKSRAPEHR